MFFYSILIIEISQVQCGDISMVYMSWPLLAARGGSNFPAGHFARGIRPPVLHASTAATRTASQDGLPEANWAPRSADYPADASRSRHDNHPDRARCGPFQNHGLPRPGHLAQPQIHASAWPPVRSYQEAGHPRGVCATGDGEKGWGPI